MVVNPVLLLVETSSIKNGIVIAIHKEVEVVGIPLHRKDVEVISKRAILQVVRSGEVFWSMCRSMNSSRLRANILHDVYFAAGRPANRLTIAAKEPESRPDSMI